MNDKHSIADSRQPYEETPEYFMELASPLRLEILKQLLTKEQKMSAIASLIDCTPQEVNRNLRRLKSAGLVTKTTNNTYKITSMAKILLTQIPMIEFLIKNKDYLESHDVEGIDAKFLKRVGALSGSKKVTGVSMVLQAWSDIYKNARSDICDIMSESPSSIATSLLNSLSTQKIRYRHIFTEGNAEPDDYTYHLKKLGYFVRNGDIQRKVTRDNAAMVVLNEKEAGIIFNTDDGKPDLRVMFYGDDPVFYSFCLDFFEHWWSKSDNYKNMSSPPTIKDRLVNKQD